MKENLLKQTKTFYKLDRASLTILLKKICNEIILVDFPEFKDKVSFIMIGSAATGDYNKDSDLDIMLIFHNEADLKKYKFKIFDKYRVPESPFAKSAIEFHGKNMISFKQIENIISNFSTDWKLIELHSALILHDPQHKYTNLIKKYKWYPRDIYQAKLRWLFADASFYLSLRYKGALEKNKFYYAEICKLRIIKHLANAILLLNKKFPSPDKHLIEALGKVPNKAKKEILLINKLAKSTNHDEIQRLLQKFYFMVEEELLIRKLIDKGNGKYWQFLTPQIKVDLET